MVDCEECQDTGLVKHYKWNSGNPDWVELYCTCEAGEILEEEELEYFNTEILPGIEGRTKYE